jgi:hypothetical protein
MKQLKKKKTQGKKVKAQQDPTIFNGTLVGTWKNSDIYKVTFVSGAMIVKYGNDEYRPSVEDIKEAERAWRDIAIKFGIDTRKVIIANG